MELYKTAYPKLCVFTNVDKSFESKELFLSLLEEDPFLKYINYNESPSKMRHQETKRIKALYDDKYETTINDYKAAKSEKKPNLDSKVRNLIMDKLEKLRENYSAKNFFEMKYYLFRTSDKYNVTLLMNILDKIKK